MIWAPWALLLPLAEASVCGAARHTVAGGHSCGGRVTWLVDHMQLPVKEAGLRVAREFPVECWRCLEMGCEAPKVGPEALRQLQMMNCGKVTKASLQFKAGFKGTQRLRLEGCAGRYQRPVGQQRATQRLEE